jgi:hypothetical protein
VRSTAIVVVRLALRAALRFRLERLVVNLYNLQVALEHPPAP